MEHAVRRPYEDAAAVARAVADALVLAAHAASAEEPLTVALAGGSTPQRLYELLAARGDVPWEKIELFFGDERAVPPDAPDSNYRMVKHALLDKVSVRSHRMRAEEGAALDYEALLRARVRPDAKGVPSFDVVLLGMGGDGHTASLFPGTAALEERERLVVMNEVPQLHTRRMTVTYPLLAAAKRAWVLVCGADKAEMLGRALGPDAGLPIQRVRPAGELVCWCDRAALGKSA